jgi:hypothetical protein
LDTCSVGLWPDPFGISTTGEVPGIISGFLFMGFTYLGVYLISHVGKKYEKNQFKVVEVMGHAANLPSNVSYKKEK